MIMRRTLAAVVLTILISGCASTGGPMSTPGTPSSATPSASAPGDVPAARWTAILADLAARGAATDDVQLVSARQVTWSDGSLGCPQPGQSYTQAVVDGMQVVVGAAGKQYDYRFGASDHPRLCVRAAGVRGIRVR